MWVLTALPLLVALAAAVVAWRHATRLDRWSVNEGWPGEAGEERRSWSVPLGALVAAMAAVALLQLTLLSRLAHAMPLSLG
jgi:hypothetical protein